MPAGNWVNQRKNRPPAVGFPAMSQPGNVAIYGKRNNRFA